MASGDRRGNPFGWIVLGFLFGVAATLVFLMFARGDDRAPDASPEPEKPAVSAAPAAKPAHAPAAVPTAAAPTGPAPLSPEDAQIAEDAAASGLTARSLRP